MMGCNKCPAGTVSAAVGATSPATCERCPRGSWSPNPGAPSSAECLLCTPGTYNEDQGSSAQSSCTKCPTGTWGEKSGAESHEDCTTCQAGMYQPAVGQANKSQCIRCEPGKYSPVPGVAACVPCPAGSWSAGFQSTECSICPVGQWTFADGSMRSTDCTPCHGSRFCLGGASALVTAELLNLDPLRTNNMQLNQLRSRFAGNIAEVLELPAAEVKDLFGNAGSSTVTAARPAGGTGAKVSAYIVVPQGSSTNALAAKLYSDVFREMIVQSAGEVLGTSPAIVGQLSAPSAAIQPKQFIPLHVTTTATTTVTTAVVTTALPTTTVTTTSVVMTSSLHMDMPVTTKSTEPMDDDVSSRSHAWNSVVFILVLVFMVVFESSDINV
jgi:hypothetical protein